MQDDLNILGVGIDLCDTARIKNMLQNYGDSFIKKTFTENEIRYCSKKADFAQHYAARFAAKEAMAKALKTGISGKITLLSLSVENDENGAPLAVLDDNAQKILMELGAKKMHISLTHLKDYAQAIAVLSK